MTEEARQLTVARDLHLFARDPMTRKPVRIKSPKFVLWRSLAIASGRLSTPPGAPNYYWHLKSRNGEIICQSQGYRTKHAAVMSIHRTIDVCGRLAKRERIIEEQ